MSCIGSSKSTREVTAGTDRLPGRWRMGICLTVLLWGAGSVRPLSGAALNLDAPVSGTLKALTVFARFADEDDGNTALPPFARELFDAGRPGSLSHFYLEMSRGQFSLDGSVLATWVTVSGDRSRYIPPEGNYGDFVREVLAQVDARLDLGRFDDDGPDGRPNSGDDDGYVDYIFVVTRSAPAGFIRGEATGVAGLGLQSEYATSDPSSSPLGRVKVRADSDPRGAGGSVQQGHTFEVAVGNMAHEMGHYLGLVDLYDLGSRDHPDQPPEEDSAGIGYWGLMAHGPRGWNEQGGPNPFCAWSLKRLGWLGIANSQLRVVRADIDSARIGDVNAGGTVYQVPIRGESEYLLVEARMRGTSYYERNLPGEGVLIWHVAEGNESNDDEHAKHVDLVCADGLYRDAGFGRGTDIARFDGGDNLDFWSHDAAYRESHAGNLGDGTDPFDGARFTDYWRLTNPAAPSGISVTGIRRSGNDFYAQIRVDDPRRAGPVTREEAWNGSIEMVGDVTVHSGAKLILGPGTQIRVGPDGLGGGMDSTRSELKVEGSLVTETGGRAPVRFTSAAPRPAAGDWYGILWADTTAAALQNAVLEYPYVGLQAGTIVTGLRLRQVTVRQAKSDGIRVECSGRAGSEYVVDGVQVVGCGGRGAVYRGSGAVRVTDTRIADNAGGGLVRLGGGLECTDSFLAHNGASADTAANLTMGGLASGSRAFGSLSATTFTGGIGVRCLGVAQLSIEKCRFVENRVALYTMTSKPRISGNLFDRSGLVLMAEGYTVPSRVDLNVVQGADFLVRNHAQAALTAINNWWGSADPVWIAQRMEGDVTWKPFLNYDPRQKTVEFRLSPNFPNPFDGSTRIEYEVGVNELVVTGRTRTVVEIRSIMGGRVRRLVDAPAAPGSFVVDWDGRDDDGCRAASGVYYCELRVGPIVKRRSLVLLR